MKLATIGQLSFHQESFRSSVTRHGTRRSGAVSAEVEVVDGVEKYSAIRDGAASYNSFDQLPGTWSCGEAAAILRLSLDLLLTESETIQIEDGDPAFVWFHHASAAIMWTFTTRGRVYPLPFTGKIVFSRARDGIEEIEWRATDLPPETQVSEVRWSVNFGESTVGNRVQTVPRSGLYSVTWKSGHVDRNETLFSNFKFYGSESVIEYQE